MLQYRYEYFLYVILILSFCVYVSTLHFFFLYILSYSGLIIFFDMLFLVSVLLFALREAFKL